MIVPGGQAMPPDSIGATGASLSEALLDTTDTSCTSAAGDALSPQTLI
jgi:hypothetical protein